MKRRERYAVIGRAGARAVTQQLRQNWFLVPDPKVKARFIEPMLLQPADKLAEGALWLAGQSNPRPLPGVRTRS